jgi:hypothetical protein
MLGTSGEITGKAIKHEETHLADLANDIPNIWSQFLSAIDKK